MAAGERFETTLRGDDLARAQRMFAASGLRSRAAFVRVCITSRLACNDPELEECIAAVGLLANMLLIERNEDSLAPGVDPRQLDKLIRAQGRIIQLSRGPVP